MILFIKALIYIALHPFEPVHYTIVRRYADAQKHFIGELYAGDGREAKMIGMACDSFPLDPVDDMQTDVRWGESFLDPMPAFTIRAGGAEPSDNAKVHEYVATRRFAPIRITILNRFVEHILESDYVR